MKKFFLIFATATLAIASTAQNSAVWKAEELMNDNEIKKAREVITPALTNPKTTKKAFAYNIAGNIESRLLQKEVEKAAAQQPLDTAMFITYLDNSVEYFTLSDKYDREPNEKGKVKSEYYANNRKMMLQILSYYAYAGQFENQRGNKKGAYEAFLKFLEAPKAPIFSKKETDSIYAKGQDTYNRVGYYATMLAFEDKDYDRLLKTVDYAIADESSRNDGYMMKLSALLHKGDTAQWVEVSKKAIAEVSDNPNFCNNLLFYYNKKKLDNEAKATADELVKQAPDNKMAYYARGCVSMNTFKKYEEARADFDKAIELDANFTEAIYNKGVSYVNELISLNLNTDIKSEEYKKTLEKAKDYYQKALPLFEKVRMLAPDNKELWVNNLRNIYYNLEMEDKVKEMEAIQNAM